MPVHEEGPMLQEFYARLRHDIDDIDEMKDYKCKGEKQSVKSYGWNDLAKYSEKLWEKIDSNIIKGEKSMETPIGLIPSNEETEKAAEMLIYAFEKYKLHIKNSKNIGETGSDFKITFTIPQNQITKIMDNLKRRSAGILLPKIEKVIFNDPATIVFWEDETKTVVHVTNEPFDKEKGLAMAISKKAYGNDYGYYNIFKKNGAESKSMTEEIK